ncbi:hypothetical protein ACLQ24_08810 [Micromonospora sp. DT4]|uniref:hypothetical protein n=1 Tax=Micromonospora sp. DT4 TaxID=3393438 RepID=UPI003CF5DFCA
MGEDDGREWRERQQRAVRAHADADARRRAAEQAQAAELVAWFVAEAARRGLPTTRLVAFHLLTVPGGLRARLLGVDPQPSPPPLVVGAGGRDGESIPLRTLLTRLLDGGTDEPGSTT